MTLKFHYFVFEILVVLNFIDSPVRTGPKNIKKRKLVGSSRITRDLYSGESFMSAFHVVNQAHPTVLTNYHDTIPSSFH